MNDVPPDTDDYSSVLSDDHAALRQHLDQGDGPQRMVFGGQESIDQTFIYGELPATQVPLRDAGDVRRATSQSVLPVPTNPRVNPAVFDAHQAHQEDARSSVWASCAA